MALLQNRIEIDEGRPLPQHDGVFAKAYAAKGKGAEQIQLAYVCTEPMATRGDQASALRSFSQPAIIRLRDSGSLEWAPSGGRAYAFVYDMPAGQRLMQRGGTCAPMKEEMLIEKLVHPLTSVLGDLGRAGIFHGAVRADNVY